MIVRSIVMCVCVSYVSFAIVSVMISMIYVCVVVVSYYVCVLVCVCVFVFICVFRIIIIYVRRVSLRFFVCFYIHSLSLSYDECYVGVFVLVVFVW